MELYEKILLTIKEHIKENDSYINPYFIQGITDVIYEYYTYEDDEVNNITNDMWER